MKMTKQRINRIRNKITESRTRLMESNPLFSLLLMHLRFFATDKIKTASTNGKSIFFHPAYIDKLYPVELDFLLCHISLHIIFDDVGRDFDLKGHTYHHACDIVNNNVLQDCGFDSPGYPHLGKIQKNYPFKPKDEECTNIDAMTVYLCLPYKMDWFPEDVIERMLVDTDLFWGVEYFDYDEMILISEPEKEYPFYHPDIKSKSKSQNPTNDNNEASIRINSESGQNEIPAKDGKKQTIQELSSIVQGILTLLKEFLMDMKTTGSGSLLEKRNLVKVKKPKTDWRSLLSCFIQEEICDYSFLPPDRRFSDSPFFMPDFNDTDTFVKDILFMVDTSASMSVHDISVAFAEIRNAIDQFAGKIKGWIGFFDAEVENPKPFSDISDIKNILPSGGGGTDFFAVFDYVSSKMKENPPASIVIMSDGDAEFPEESEAIGIPVLWLINNDHITPPWGQCVRMDNTEPEYD